MHFRRKPPGPRLGRLAGGQILKPGGDRDRTSPLLQDCPHQRAESLPPARLTPWRPRRYSKEVSVARAVVPIV